MEEKKEIMGERKPLLITVSSPFERYQKERIRGVIRRGGVCRRLGAV
jgi:hypothetical protein